MTEGKRVLVVDDTELIRMIYRDRLTAEGYQVSTANDGLEGERLAVEEQPALILLDLVMPRQNGLETLEHLKGDPRTRDIPVVILSNRDDDTEIKTGLELGAEDFLKKVGASPAEVAEKIKVIIDRTATRGAAAPSGEAQEKAHAAGSMAWKVYLRDKELDADRLVAAMKLPRRFWCPACEQEMELELIADPTVSGGHWFKARLVCPGCSKTF